MHGSCPLMRRGRDGAFRTGQIDVLCVPPLSRWASTSQRHVMLVMDADRFGISQLHQLRGRIGRANTQAVSVGAGSPGIAGGRRLSAVAATQDGFALADLDLKEREKATCWAACSPVGGHLAAAVAADHLCSSRPP